MSSNYRPPHKDERLVMFLQKFRPSAPPAPPDGEERLFFLLDCPLVGEEGEGTPVPARARIWKRWALPIGTFAVGSLLFAWGGYRLQAPQIAERRAEELEEFIVRSWEGFTPAPMDTLRSFEAEWLLHQDESAGIGTAQAEEVSPANFGVQAEPASYP